MFRRQLSCATFVCIVALLLTDQRSDAQTDPGQDVFGVYVDPTGTLRQRAVSPKELGLLRERARKATDAKVAGGLHFVSLNKLFADARKLAEQNHPLPDAIKHLGGLTQIQYVFAYPQEKDLVIAGPAEEIDKTVP